MNVAQSPPNYFTPFSSICNFADLTFIEHFPFFIKKKSLIYFRGSPPLPLFLAFPPSFSPSFFSSTFDFWTTVNIYEKPPIFSSLCMTIGCMFVCLCLSY